MFICDGTKKRGAWNCEAAARWRVRRQGETGTFHSACDRHLAQVGRNLLKGERGRLEVRSVYSDER